MANHWKPLLSINCFSCNNSVVLSWDLFIFYSVRPKTRHQKKKKKKKNMKIHNKITKRNSFMRSSSQSFAQCLSWIRLDRNAISQIIFKIEKTAFEQVVGWLKGWPDEVLMMMKLMIHLYTIQLICINYFNYKLQIDWLIDWNKITLIFAHYFFFFHYTIVIPLKL